MKLRSRLIACACAVLLAAGTAHAAAAERRDGRAKAGAKAGAKKPAAAVRKAAPKRTVKTKVKMRPSMARTLSQDLRSARARPAVPPVIAELDRDGNPLLKSAAFMVQDLDSGDVLLERNAQSAMPIASITKLMTAMVVLDAHQSLTEWLDIGDEDTDKLKGTSSRLAVGTILSREQMIHLALMSSENRAAAALARHYPGGAAAFVAAMNRKAQVLGLSDTQFHDSTGLNPNNVSSARDLARMVSAASHYPLIREFSTDDEELVEVRGRLQTFRNTNALVSSPEWQIGVSKTGFINEAGRCLVMQAWLGNKPMVIVLLDSVGKFTRVADAQRIKRWVETALASRAAPRLPAAG